jgi:hypothetical protein
MKWNLGFISEEDFTKHVKSTIKSMGKSWNHLILSVLIKTLLTQLNLYLTK